MSETTAYSDKLISTWDVESTVQTRIDDDGSAVILLAIREGDAAAEVGYDRRDAMRLARAILAACEAADDAEA